MVKENVGQDYNVCWTRTSWGAVFAGVIVILIVQLTLGLLGLSIGLWTIDPGSENQPLAGLGIGSAIWWVLTSLIAVYIGAWVSGFLSGTTKQPAMVHGIVTWGVATLISVYLLTAGVGAIVGGALNVVQSGLNMMSGAVSSLMQAVPEGAIPNINQIQKEIEDTLGQQGEDVNVQQVMGEVRQAVQRLFDQDGATAADQQEVVDLLVTRLNMNPPEAQRLVTRWISAYENAQQRMQQFAGQAQEVGGQTAQVVGTAAFWSFIMLVLSAVVAALGGSAGGIKGLRHA